MKNVYEVPIRNRNKEWFLSKIEDSISGEWPHFLGGRSRQIIKNILRKNRFFSYRSKEELLQRGIFVEGEPYNSKTQKSLGGKKKTHTPCGWMHMGRINHAKKPLAATLESWEEGRGGGEGSRVGWLLLGENLWFGGSSDWKGDWCEAPPTKQPHQKLRIRELKNQMSLGYWPLRLLLTKK